MRMFLVLALSMFSFGALAQDPAPTSLDISIYQVKGNQETLINSGSVYALSDSIGVPFSITRDKSYPAIRTQLKDGVTTQIKPDTTSEHLNVLFTPRNEEAELSVDMSVIKGERVLKDVDGFLIIKSNWKANLLVPQGNFEKTIKADGATYVIKTNYKKTLD